MPKFLAVLVLLGNRQGFPYELRIFFSYLFKIRWKNSDYSLNYKRESCPFVVNHVSGVLGECKTSPPDIEQWKDRELFDGDSPPVGLILCTDKNQTKVEYAIGGLDRQIFVSRYMVALPTPDQLQRLLEADIAHWQQNHPLQTSSEYQP